MAVRTQGADRHETGKHETGDHLVCLHGFTGQPESWREVLQEVRRANPSWTSHCPSLLGHGTAPPVSSGHSFDAEVDRLAQLVEQACPRPAHLVGYSMGGRLALGLLARYGHLFDSATLIGVHGGLGSLAARRDRAAIDAERASRLEEHGLEAFLESWQALPLFASQRRLPAEVSERQAHLRRQHGAAGLATALRQLSPAGMPDYLPRLGSFKGPVRLLVGELDAKFQRLAPPLLDALPHAELHIVPDVGHNVVLEAPKAVAKQILIASSSTVEV